MLVASGKETAWGKSSDGSLVETMVLKGDLEIADKTEICQNKNRQFH
jgi:hypothetical protein